MERHGNLVCADLARRIGRLALQRMIFGDRHEARRAINLARRRLHHLADAKVARRLDNAQRALDVGVDVSVRGVVRIRYGDQGREVQYRVAVLHGGAHAIGVAHIAREHLELALYVCCAAVEPTPGVEGVVHDKGADFVALPNKGFCQVRADEAVGAGDEDGFHSLLVLECAPDVDKEAVIFFDGISESVTSI